jgi:ribosomal protein S28E/S33
MLNLKKLKIIEKVKRSGTYGEVLELKVLDQLGNSKYYKVIGPCKIGEYIYDISQSEI